jgi:hypothetical protein
LDLESFWRLKAQRDEIDNATLSEVFYGIYFHENISSVLGSGKFFA